jgi:hypothetical protein
LASIEIHYQFQNALEYRTSALTNCLQLDFLYLLAFRIQVRLAHKEPYTTLDLASSCC